MGHRQEKPNDDDGRLSLAALVKKSGNEIGIPDLFIGRREATYVSI